MLRQCDGRKCNEFVVVVLLVVRSKFLQKFLRILYEIFCDHFEVGVYKNGPEGSGQLKFVNFEVSSDPRRQETVAARELCHVGVLNWLAVFVDSERLIA